MCVRFESSLPRLLGRAIVSVLGLAMGVEMALAAPDFVRHDPAGSVAGEPPEITMREPFAPREGEHVSIWAMIEYSDEGTDAALYYTYDGSDPQGSFGAPSTSSTLVVPMAPVRTELTETGEAAWLRGLIPDVATYGGVIRYRLGAWQEGDSLEVFANSFGCADGVCDPPSSNELFSYTVKMSWPGRGDPHGPGSEGIPAPYFWKEEGVVGNNHLNVQVDRNGTLYDIYFPSAGCIQGVAARSEGYAAPDMLSASLRETPSGQMHVNQAQAGLRVDGVTFWLSNEGGAYNNHAQGYVPRTNVLRTSSRLSAADIVVDQYDFCPKGVSFPRDAGGRVVQGIYVKRYLLTNSGPTARTLDFYYHADFAVNGGEAFDGMFADPARGALVAYDSTQRLASFNAEYNPASYADYLKNAAVYFGAALKLCDSVGSAGGTPATDSWRDSSADNRAGWVGIRFNLQPGQTREVDVAIVGGWKSTSDPVDVYLNIVAAGLDWFHASSMSSVQASTESWWNNWLASGVTMDLPDRSWTALFERALLTLALHQDSRGGGIISGMHNGAYPYVRPRDALFSAVTLDRTGHHAEATEVFRFLRSVAARPTEAWGKGFWYAKYTTDGYPVWTGPQVDATAMVPWAGYYHYLSTGSLPFLQENYATFAEAARAMSEDSRADKRLYFDTARNLMHSATVWDDGFDRSIYSNAAVARGLRDAALIAKAVNRPADAELFSGRANAILGGLNARLDWDGENTDVSQLGLVWPYETHSPIEVRMAHVMDRINGIANDRFGNNRPLVNVAGEFQDLVNRYWGDAYWNGGPWALSTLWYGHFYARRQDTAPGKADIDNFRYRLDRVREAVGSLGIAAEQIAPAERLLYPEDASFRLQAAWPTSWTSAGALVDAMMMFLDHRPDAPNNRILLAPKLPTGWERITCRNLRVGARTLDVTCSESPSRNTVVFTNTSGGVLGYQAHIRVPPVAVLTSVIQNGKPVEHVYESGASRVRVTGALATPRGSTTTVEVTFNDVAGDMNHDGRVDAEDFVLFRRCTGRTVSNQPECTDADFNRDGRVDVADFAAFQRCYSGPDRLADPRCDD